MIKKQKFKIPDNQSISDSVQCQTSQFISKTHRQTKEQCLKTDFQNSSSLFQKLAQNSSKISFADENSQKASHPTIQLRSLRTVFKSINKFKQAHTRCKNMKKAMNKNRINNNVNVFIQKISRSAQNDTIHLTQIQQQQPLNFLNRSGLQIPFVLQIFQIVLNTLVFLTMFIFLTLYAVFQDQIHSPGITYFQVGCALAVFLNIVMKFITVGFTNGKRLQKIRDIAVNYLKGQFIFDFLCFSSLFLDLILEKNQVKFLRFVFLIKFFDFKQNIQKLEYYFINTFYKEQYWGICHLITSNFLVAHIIAIILLLFLQIDPNHNWLTKAGIDNVQWYEQYVWAYYWAVTTMLSIGYGDITVANYRQAIYMVFVQIFSCIILAYTINSVGNLIQKLRSQDLQKNKNLKIFKQIADKNNLSRKLEQKINSYINESTEIKTNFNYEDQKKLINELPPDTRHNVLKECNSKLFLSVSVFKNLSQKIICELANKIQMKIAHPQQVIFIPNNTFQLQILKQGKVGYCTIEDRYMKKYVMNELETNSENLPKCLSLHFLSGNEAKFNICSLSYSLIYHISIKQLQRIFKNYPCDNQKISILKDKSKHILDQFQVVSCHHCKTNHVKADCPKCHYIPLNHMIIWKYQFAKKQKDCERAHFFRAKIQVNCYKLTKQLKNFKEQMNYIKYGKIHAVNTVKQYILNQLFGQEDKNYECEIQPKSKQKLKMKNLGPKPSNQLLQSCSRKRKKSINISTLYKVTNQILKNLKYSQQHVFCQSQKQYSTMGWQSDVLHDFIVYFPEMNPKAVSKRFKYYLNQKQNTIKQTD